MAKKSNARKARDLGLDAVPDAAQHLAAEALANDLYLDLKERGPVEATVALAAVVARRCLDGGDKCDAMRRGFHALLDATIDAMAHQRLDPGAPR